MEDSKFQCDAHQGGMKCAPRKDFAVQCASRRGRQEAIDTRLSDVTRQGECQIPQKSVEISRGSKNHSNGQCRPCRLYFTPAGCPDGALCNFCHHYHDEGKLLQMGLLSVKGKLRRVLAKQMQLEDAIMKRTMPESAHTLDLHAGQLVDASFSSSPNDVKSLGEELPKSRHLTTSHQQPVQHEINEKQSAPNPAMLPWPSKMAHAPPKEQY